MQGYHREPHVASRIGAGRPTLHTGVRQFMNGVYAWMAAGIAITAAVAWGIGQSPETFQMIWGSPLGLILSIGTFIGAIALQRVVNRLDRPIAIGAFGVYSAAMGVALSYIPVFYPVGDIGLALVATIGMFAAMAVIGFVTKKDLSGMGQFFVMALIGAIIGSVANAFIFQSASVSFGISALVAVISAGLTAYYTQAIKQMYRVQGGRGNLAILGALVLYINFINLFLSLLRIFSGGRE